MRPIETLLAGTLVISFINLILPLPASMQWLRSVAPLIVMVAGFQIIAEGARWQMFPAYALAIIFFLVWIFVYFRQDTVNISGIVAGFGIVLGVMGILLAIFLPVALPVFTFPQPTGSYAVGTITYHWVDNSRSELFTDDPDDYREIVAQVWYPTEKGVSGTIAPYIQDGDLVTRRLSELFHLPWFTLDHLKYITTHAVISAPIAADQAAYPVLIYLSGLDGFRSVSTFQIEELVSQGYIVVGLDQPGATVGVRLLDGREVLGWQRDDMQPFIDQSVNPQPDAPILNDRSMPDGIIPYFAQDASFALDQLELLNIADPQSILTGYLDLEHVGVFGISLGGINAAQACYNDARFRACLIMDAPIPDEVVKGGLQQLTMIITRDADTMRLERERAGGWTEYDIEQHQRTMRAIYESLPGDGYYLQIPGIFHLNFTDAPYWSPFLSQIGMTAAMDRQRAFDIINTYTVAFFDNQLKGQPSPLLEGDTTTYPEVIFEHQQ
ncbi:MAG: carboxylic ester hydrolase [Anaerolineae bacterium]|nr:carboxylic ester hydrolase [Anaerolineae bacterium]